MVPDLTITIVSWNTVHLLRACLQSLRAGSAFATVEVHVVDNASTDGSVAMVRQEFPEVKLLVNQVNSGFARANNQSWERAHGRYWLLLNADAEVRPGALDVLVNFMDARPQAALATARLVNADGTPQYCACAEPSVWQLLLEGSRIHKLLPARVRARALLGTYWTYDSPIRLGYTWGTALIARREAVVEGGPLCEAFFMYGEDLEWCLRLRRLGWEIWFCPNAEVLHHGAQSASRHWEAPARRERIWDSYYQALSMHHSHCYMALLRLVTLVSLSVDLVVAKLRRRLRTPDIQSALTYHVRSIRTRPNVGASR